LQEHITLPRGVVFHALSGLLLLSRLPEGKSFVPDGLVTALRGALDLADQGNTPHTPEKPERAQPTLAEGQVPSGPLTEREIEYALLKALAAHPWGNAPPWTTLFARNIEAAHLIN